MVPELAFVVGIVAVLRQHALHHSHDRLGTSLALLLGGQIHGDVYHLLHLPSVFRQDELFSLGIVIQSFYIHLL